MFTTKCWRRLEARAVASFPYPVASTCGLAIFLVQSGLKVRGFGAFRYLALTLNAKRWRPAPDGFTHGPEKGIARGDTAVRAPRSKSPPGPGKRRRDGASVARDCF